MLRLHGEGIQQATEAVEISKKLDNIFELAHSIQCLAWSLGGDGQRDAAEEATSRAMDLLPDDQYLVSRCRTFLGNTCRYKGETEKAIEHFEMALSVASSFSWHNEQFWVYYSLVLLSADLDRLDDAQAHFERAKPYVVHSTYTLGRTMELQARLWRGQSRLEEARSEILRAVDLFEKTGVTTALEACRNSLTDIDAEMKGLVASDESGVDGELLGTAPLPMATDFTFLAHKTKWYRRLARSLRRVYHPAVAKASSLPLPSPSV